MGFYGLWWNPLRLRDCPLHLRHHRYLHPRKSDQSSLRVTRRSPLLRLSRLRYATDVGRKT